MEAMLADAPMSVAMRQSLDADTYEKLTAEQRQVAESLIEGHGPVRMDAEYLLIVARKPG
jgi:hypothetical protein